jgi:hypothetical protein
VNSRPNDRAIRRDQSSAPPTPPTKPSFPGANDWTVDIERQGLPELRHIYELQGAPSDAVEARWHDSEHNYNARSRAQMYRFFNQHLELGHGACVVGPPETPLARLTLAYPIVAININGVPPSPLTLPTY